jgi:hypothetical protein
LPRRGKLISPTSGLTRAGRARRRFNCLKQEEWNERAAITEKERIEHGWTTHLRGEEVEAAFAAAGFRSVGERRSDREMTTIWLWEASPR